MFPVASFSTLNLITLAGVWAAHDLTAFVFILSSLVPGLNTFTPWGALAFCMAYAWLGELTPHTLLTQSALCAPLFCFVLHPHSTCPLCLCVFVCLCVWVLFFFFFFVPYMFVFVLVVFCLYLSGPLPSPTSHRTLPSLSSLFLCPVPLWLRCSRRHSQTHSGVLTQSGHDTEWPAAPQTGVERFGLVAGEPRRKWVSFFLRPVPENCVKHKRLCNSTW